MPQSLLCWVDDQQTHQLLLPDRGLDFGDGVFETLLLCQGRPLWLDVHRNRLQQGLQRLGFDDHHQALCAERLQMVAAQVQKQAWRFAALRVTVSRGAGPRGYQPPIPPQPRCIYTVSEQAEPGQCPPCAASIVTARWPQDVQLSGIKHLNRLPQVLAAQELAASQAAEGVMLDQQGRIVSVVAGNVFLRAGQQLFTPKLESAGVKGTRRQQLIDSWAAELGLAVVAADIYPQQLSQFEEAFYCNALRGYCAIGQIDAVQYRDFSTSEALQERYLEACSC